MGQAKAFQRFGTMQNEPPYIYQCMGIVFCFVFGTSCFGFSKVTETKRS